MANMLRRIERNAYREAFGQAKMGDAWRCMRGRNWRKYTKLMAQTLVAAKPKQTPERNSTLNKFVDRAKKAVLRTIRRGA